ncbi:MAG TPA: toprim domain-containing protein [Ghiorsea sp.]|nr:toprim domain-containing protein [Ghiorsea sp.]
MADTELERFKTEIPIQQYLVNQGWTLDKKKSSKKHAVLSDGYSKVVVARNENGHYVWFDTGTGKGGSIIDLVQDLTGKNLGQVRKELRSYIGGEISPHSSSLSPMHLERSDKDEQAVAQLAERWATLKPLDQRYVNSRGITHIDERFSNIKTDSYGNTCFPHYKFGRVVGWEKKNFKFTGFEKGSLRSESVYASMNLRDASQVVIVESGIDALSHARLFQTDSSVAYISIGGQLTDKQVELIKEITQGKHVIIATDNDEAGFKYADRLRKELDHVSWQIPESKDWNDDLKAKQQQKRERAATRTRSSSFELGM